MGFLSAGYECNIWDSNLNIIVLFFSDCKNNIAVGILEHVSTKKYFVMYLIAFYLDNF